MARGPKKHLKRIRTPKSWLLDKLTGVYAPRPRCGPHKLRDSLPLQIVLRNRLKYALTGKEAGYMLLEKDNQIKIDGKLRTDPKYPMGLMDVMSIDKTGERFRMLYDIKGRFTMVKIREAEAQYKLCRVKNREMGPNRIPYLTTHDARTIRFADPHINVCDTVKVDLKTGNILSTLKLQVGALVLVTGGANRGRVGVIHNRTRLQGAFDMINIKDVNGHSFNTRIDNCFVIGENDKPTISLPRGKGVKLNIIEEQEKRLGA